MGFKKHKDINPFKKWVFISLGSFFVGLAFLGVLLPVLPTTPFLLVSAYFYARSSQKFYDWLHENRLFGQHLKNYREGKGMKLSVKVGTISLLWLTIGITTIFAVHNLIIRIVLVLIAIGVTVHLIIIPNCVER